MTLSSACGGGSDYKTETNAQEAALAVMQLAGINSGVQAGSADTTASGMLQLGSVAQSIIVPVMNQPGGQPQPTARIFSPGANRAPAAPGQIDALSGTCSCDATGCVFMGCSDDAAGFTIDGSIAVSGDSYNFDVSITQSSTVNTTATTTHMSTSGDITLGATSIDGSVSGKGDTTVVVTSTSDQQTIKGSWNWNMNANQIALDSNRCAVGGALDTCFSAHASSSGRSVQYNGCGTVDFGPMCGQAVAE